MRTAWITLDGNVHEEGDHGEIAKRLFPDALNPELACEKIGYVKMGHLYNRSPMMENAEPNRITQAQRNTIEDLWKEHYKKI